jgi:hypothetical protein
MPPATTIPAPEALLCDGFSLLHYPNRRMGGHEKKGPDANMFDKDE